MANNKSVESEIIARLQAFTRDLEAGVPITERHRVTLLHRSGDRITQIVIDPRVDDEEEYDPTDGGAEYGDPVG